MMKVRAQPSTADVLPPPTLSETLTTDIVESETRETEVTLDTPPQETGAEDVIVAATTSSPPEIVSSLDTDATSTIPERRERVDGSHFNYDNSDKCAWRQGVVIAHLEKHIPPERRGDVRILCLGGQQNYEPQAYINAGCRPENITSVECDPSTFNTFRRTGASLGIQTHCGDLEQMPHAAPYDVVSLDYHGRINLQKCVDVLHIPLADKALLMINVQAKREDRQIKTQGLLTQALCAGTQIDATSSLDEVWDRFTPVSFLGDIEERAEGKLPPEEWRQIRAEVTHQMIGAFGECLELERLHASFPHLLEALNIAPQDEGEPDAASLPHPLSYGKRFSDAYCKALARYTGMQPPEFFRNVQVGSLMGLRLYLLRKHVVQDISFTRYLSHGDNGSASPFLTCCAVLHRPADFYQQTSRTFDEFAEWLNQFFSDPSADPHVTMRHAQVFRSYSLIPWQSRCKLSHRHSVTKVTRSFDVSRLNTAQADLRAIMEQDKSLYRHADASFDEAREGEKQARVMQEYWGKIFEQQRQQETRLFLERLQQQARRRPH
jgi:hypothetical protein